MEEPFHHLPAAILPQTPRNVGLGARGVLASFPQPRWKGRVPLSAAQMLGVTLLGFTCGAELLPSPVLGQGPLLLPAALFCHLPLSQGMRAVLGELPCAPQLCWDPCQQCWSRQGPAVCRQTDRQTDTSVLCAPGAPPGEHGKQMLDRDLLEEPRSRFLPCLCGRGWSRELGGDRESSAQAWLNGMSAHVAFAEHKSSPKSRHTGAEARSGH